MPFQPELPDLTRDVYTVSRLNQEARALLNGHFPLLWVEAEISNLSRPASGHLYFTLKDGNAQIRCAMFRNNNLHLRFKPEDGMRLLVRGRVGLYEARGEFQLTVEHMQDAGAGDLQRAFELLKKKLAKEGLFDEHLKQTLPEFPRNLAVITSPTGAALRDILSVLQRRFPALPVTVYGVQVQGKGSAEAISTALRSADRSGHHDVLLLSRGGGSLEDLWSFNEEIVARAIADCATPVVAGVGHEVDFTIADFCADVRAPTPSAAAELISPDQEELLMTFAACERSLQRSVEAQLDQHNQQLSWLQGRLKQQHPRQQLQQRALRVDELEQRLALTLRLIASTLSGRIGALSTRLQQASPRVSLAQATARQVQLARRLTDSIDRRLVQNRHTLEKLAASLNTVSPLATLDRGYAIVTREADSAVVRASTDVSVGESVNVRLARGRVKASVTGANSD